MVSKMISPNEQTREKLAQALDAAHVDIVDNSWQHAGHVAMANVNEAYGTHLAVTIVSPQFQSVNLLNRHRMVHTLLKEEFEGVLHALELKTYTPEEWQAQQSAIQ